MSKAKVSIIKNKHKGKGRDRVIAILFLKYWETVSEICLFQ